MPTLLIRTLYFTLTILLASWFRAALFRTAEPDTLFAEQIERRAMEQLLERQESGDKLTAAEFAFLAKIKQMDNEKAVTAKITAKLPLSERLQAKKESWFESLCWVAENSKSHMARVTAVQTLKKWADEEGVPLEPYFITDAHPENEPVPTMPVTNY